MKTRPDILIDVLRIKIEQINKYRNLVKDFKNTMGLTFNISFDTSVDILNQKIPLESLSNDMLYKVTKSLYETIKEKPLEFELSDLTISRYFNETEIQNYDKPVEINREDEDIEIEQWLKVNEDQYVCVIPIEQIMEWRAINKIEYNPNVQRELKIKVKSGVQIRVIKIILSAKKEIMKLMKSNNFISDELTLNVDPDYYDVPYIENRTLIIPKESKIDIIDGFHRLVSMWQVKEDNPSWNYNCIINITAFNENKALKYILQKDKKNHFSRERITELDRASERNYLINRLNEDNEFHLRNTISKEIAPKLMIIVDSLFEIQGDRPETVKISKFIRDNLNKYIEDNNYYNKTFDLNEWFVYLYLLKYSYYNNYNFIDLVKEINIENLAKKINYKKTVLVAHREKMDDIIEKVVKNV